MSTKQMGIDARLAKAEGFTFDQVQSAVAEKLEDLYPDVDPEARWQKGPWIRDIYDDNVIYCWEGVLYRVGYGFNESVATLSGSPEAVKVEYVPLGGAPGGSQANGPGTTPTGSAAAPPPEKPAATPAPSAEAGKRAIESELFQKASKGADEALAALAKRATPATPPKVSWPSDMSPVSKRRNAVAIKG
jgi:hypothetical protein